MCTPEDKWCQGVGVSKDSFDQGDSGGGMTGVTGDGAPYSASGSGADSSQNNVELWSFDPVDHSKNPPPSIDLPPELNLPPNYALEPAPPPLPENFNQDNNNGGGTVPPAAHDDPIVGQGKVVDPGDKTWGVKGTWDFDSPPKVTGVYGDPPTVGPLNPSGDQLDTTADTPGGDNPPTPTQYPKREPICPPGSVPEPSGIGGCRTVVPSGIPLPPPEPAPQPGDYNDPDDDTANA